MHAFSVHSVLHSSKFVEDDCSLATIDYECESSEDDSAKDEASSELSESVEKSLYHIYSGIPFLIKY